MYKAIIPECNIDTNLINVLLRAAHKKGVNHGKGISTVANKMKNGHNEQFSVGVIDRDEEDIDYVKREFEIINSSIGKYCLLHKHSKRHHYIIQICPVIETWICNVAKDVEIDLVTEYSLPAVPKELKKITGKVVSKYDPTFEKLFKHILRRSEEVNFEPVLKLQNWLRILVDNNYSADINELRK